MKKLTELELNRQACLMAQKHWGMVFDTEVKINNRLTSVLGYFRWKRKNGVTRYWVEISGDLIKNYKESTVIDVLLHEMTHWALYVKGEPNKDGHPHFENELKRVGAASTRTIKTAGTLHIAKCGECGKERKGYKHKGRISQYIRERRSGCCNSDMVYGGTRTIEDTFESVATKLK